MIILKKILLFILIIFISLSYSCGLYYDYDDTATYDTYNYSHTDADNEVIDGSTIGNADNEKISVNNAGAGDKITMKTDSGTGNGSSTEAGSGNNAGATGTEGTDINGITSGLRDGVNDELDAVSSDSALIVKEVIDGDTIILSDGRRVRLIGINTPEHGMYFYEEAKEALEIIVLGKKVLLEKDVSERDQYGRLLRYVYMGDLFVNLEMLKRGFANVYTYPPDVKYMNEFLEAERYARENNLGLWLKSDSASVEIYINYDAPGNDNINLNGEYVMIRNTGKEIIDIYGWTIKDSATSIYKFGRYLFKPGEIIYLFTGSGKDGEGKFYWGSPKPVWNNKHDTLYLRDRDGLLVEIYDY
ncbi:MAG: thermonuclease family protein [Candidatus Humimicrobiaceae bacterium]|jgi:micrococcal nuclease|nr:thermonuclease family protein [Actinomycetota bacterium]MDY0027402.1 thermonuclease family protein [Candidatus Humimicrobiaceae bacterium]